MKNLDKDIESCIEFNINTLIKTGFIKDKNDLSAKELADLKKVIKHAKGLD